MSIVTPFLKAIRRMETGGKPFVAALNGTALGGGYELALACHRRIAADASSARFGLPEATLGLMPGAGGTQRLPRLIGIAAAAPLLLEGRRLKPADALAAGLVARRCAARAVARGSKGLGACQSEPGSALGRQGLQASGIRTEHSGRPEASFSRAGRGFTSEARDATPEAKRSFRFCIMGSNAGWMPASRSKHGISRGLPPRPKRRRKFARCLSARPMPRRCGFARRMLRPPRRNVLR